MGCCCDCPLDAGVHQPPASTNEPGQANLPSYRVQNVPDESKRKIEIFEDEIDDREKEDVLLFISTRGLKDFKLLGSLDPICLVHQHNSKTNQWDFIAQTEVKDNDLNSDWGYIKIKYYFHKIQKMRFEIRVLNKEKSLIMETGHYETTLGEIMGAKQHTLEVFLKDQPASLILRVYTFEQLGKEEKEEAQKKDPSFLDYLGNGWQINCAFAIDYTGSNGPPDEEDSLHFIGPSNQYEDVIKNVGGIIEPYDSDKLFPVFGFGGIPQGESKVSNFFHVNGNAKNPFVQGFQGVLDIYRQTLPYIKLSGPTYFGSVLEKFKEHCEKQQGKKDWNVLLILTDGLIHDMEKTKELLVQLSLLPASVIIVGVGAGEEFENMYELDQHKSKLGDGEVRFTVQFVEFLKIKQLQSGLINEAVLAELPNQFMQYMKANNVLPKSF